MTTDSIHVKDVAVIGIYVSDLEAAVSFYVNDLGLEDKGSMGPGHMLALGDSSFYLEGGRDKNANKQNLKEADTAVCFGVDSVKAAYEALQKKIVQIVMKYVEYGPEYAVFMIADPSGNIIEIAGSP